MSLRLWSVLLGGMLCAGARAEVPAPQSCEQLYMAVDYALLQQAGLDDGPLLQGLSRRSGLALQPQPASKAARVDFAEGVLDLWVGMDKASARQLNGRLLEPALWQEQLLLWVRAGELASLKHWPQLDGLRGGYWPEQESTGVLQSIQGQVRLEDLRRQDDPVAAVKALLVGEIDYFMAYARADRPALLQELKAGRIEALHQPAQTRTYHLAISQQSACKDEALVARLERALQLRRK